ncbi:CHC2 zinc finger domain-containing protein [Bacteroides thetaiotaomicron]|nr:CHC2 zinc finger domain-containing protein [Bacteroides thetaiotaomicron]
MTALCVKPSKKFSINPAKDIYSCFSCHQISGSGALDYLMRVEKKEFPEGSRTFSTQV